MANQWLGMNRMASTDQFADRKRRVKYKPDPKDNGLLRLTPIDKKLLEKILHVYLNPYAVREELHAKLRKQKVCVGGEEIDKILTHLFPMPSTGRKLLDRVVEVRVRNLVTEETIEADRYNPDEVDLEKVAEQVEKEIINRNMP